MLRLDKLLNAFNVSSSITSNAMCFVIIRSNVKNTVFRDEIETKEYLKIREQDIACDTVNAVIKCNKKLSCR